MSERRDQPALRRWLAPPLTVLLFLLHPAVALWRPEQQLRDPGAGWHLISGRYMLETGSVPSHDIFSFTAADHAWINYSWLFDVSGAVLERLGGLPLYVMGWVLVYALLPPLLFRRMLRMGADLVPAFVVTLLAYIVLASHALARPHVPTYVFFALVLEGLDDFYGGRRAARSLWWLPLVALVWCNVHGGFIAGLTLAGIYAGAATLRWLWRREPGGGHRAAVLVVVLAGMALATLANPNGPHLHVSILEHLGMRTTRYFNEFQSPNFQSGNPPVVVFQGLILVLVALLARSRRRLPPIEVVLLVFFLHEALQSVRHMNLFTIVAAPIIARELTPLFGAALPALHARSRRIVAEQTVLRGGLVYFPIVAAAFMLLAVAGWFSLPTTLDGLRLSRAAAVFIDGHFDRFARPFNTDDLGGSLIYRFWPRLRVFVDDRVPVYGDAFMFDEYFDVFHSRKGWEQVLEKYAVTAAVVTSTATCARLFRASPHWESVFDDETNAIFFRRAREIGIARGPAP